ncbi:Alpha/Beta hydrolase protein [Favolaschia claudopus]|uniref:Alpha/Beta hydrolase protein n=1 Tax=Favolaschia claudopus TaxID=2862362 RepID=A0AAW0C022_9AGAR
MSATEIKRVVVDSGISVFYRTACPENNSSAPTVLLLHGYPTSSHQYRNLIPILSKHYRVIAPDLPGFGFTTVPAERDYTYTFASLATTIGAFLDALSIKSFTVYIFDYGAPVALRLALQRPEAITAIISQNGNAYEDGLGAGWAPIRKYWETGSVEDRFACRVLAVVASLNKILCFPKRKFPSTKGQPLLSRILDEVASATKSQPRRTPPNYILTRRSSSKEILVYLFTY